MKRAELSVETAALLREVFQHFNSPNAHSAGICEGIDQLRIGLSRIAARAVELGDEKLLAECQRLSLVRSNDILQKR